MHQRVHSKYNSVMDYSCFIHSVLAHLQFLRDSYVKMKNCQAEGWKGGLYPFFLLLVFFTYSFFFILFRLTRNLSPHPFPLLCRIYGCKFEYANAAGQVCESKDRIRSTWALILSRASDAPRMQVKWLVEQGLRRSPCLTCVWISNTLSTHKITPQRLSCSQMACSLEFYWCILNLKTNKH